MNKWRFRVLFFAKERALQEWLHKAVEEAQVDGYDFHDLRFAQSSASGTGMSAVLVLRKI